MESQPFIYCIDSPNQKDAIAQSFFFLSGWIVTDRNQKIENLALICSPHQQKFPLTTIPRPDVEAIYSDRFVIGFHHYFSIFDLNLSSKNWEIQFLLKDKIYAFPIEILVDPEFYQSFLSTKKEKLTKIQSILCCPVCYSEYLYVTGNIIRCPECKTEFQNQENHLNFLNSSLSEYGNLKPTSNISSNDYDPQALSIIERLQEGLILDNGCGLRKVYYPNVVNFEIVEYPTTDVVGIGEKLPFKSNVFDAVFSLAVLEHVKNPFECAREIVRVLKPGGVLYVMAPFLVPFHGYPDHYYNMTSSGLKNLFDDKIQMIESGVPASGLPIWCLTWFLNSYLKGLPPQAAETFKNLKVSDLLSDPLHYLEQDFVKQLSPDVTEELATMNYLVGRKVYPTQGGSSQVVQNSHPDFLIIGAQKCGTTSLFHYLLKHPQVFSANQKEVHFFDLNFSQGLDWYLSQFPMLPNREYLRFGEASPYYLFHPLVAQRVYDLFPEIKLIVLLRDPVQRAWSQYHHEVRLGFETLSFEEAIAQESTRLEGEVENLIADENYYSFSHQHYSYLARGIYVAQLKNWMQFFPKEQFLILQSEEFYRHPKGTLKEVMNFLQINSRELSDYQRYNAGEYSEMPDALRQQLQNYFCPYNRQLSEYLQQNFNWSS